MSVFQALCEPPLDGYPPMTKDVPIPVASIIPPGGITSNAGLSSDE
jgi:hypothetical protein